MSQTFFFPQKNVLFKKKAKIVLASQNLYFGARLGVTFTSH